MTLYVFLQRLGIHHFKGFCDFYEVGEETLCEVGHFEVPWKSWIALFIHDENGSRVVILQPCSFVRVIINPVELDILSL